METGSDFFTMCNDAHEMFMYHMSDIFEALEMTEEEGWAALAEDPGFTKEEFYNELSNLKQYDDDTWYYPNVHLTNDGIETFITDIGQEVIGTECLIGTRILGMSTEGGGKY